MRSLHIFEVVTVVTCCYMLLHISFSPKGRQHSPELLGSDLRRRERSSQHWTCVGIRPLSNTLYTNRAERDLPTAEDASP